MSVSKTLRVLYVVLGLLILIQLIPVNRDNPPVTGEFDEDLQVRDIFRQSCYDCHSNTTNWPWYSYVAPVSWLVASDVHEGREHLNFSSWQQLSEEKKEHARKEIWEEVEEGEMPMPIYLVTHSEATLTEDDKAVLYEWTHRNSEPDSEAVKRNATDDSSSEPEENDD